MKKENLTKERVDELREEYDFSQGIRGKYAARYSEGISFVLIESENWQAEAANNTLDLVGTKSGRNRKNDYTAILRRDWHAIPAHLNELFDWKEVKKSPKCYNRKHLTNTVYRRRELIRIGNGGGYSRITSLSGFPGAAKRNFRFFLC